MMFYFVVGFCAVLLTLSLMDYLNAKKRLVDKQIEDIISRKLKTERDRQTVEILNLREACGVMRNLLMDIAENETSVAALDDKAPKGVRLRVIANRDSRRRELCAEVDAVLRSSTDFARADASL